MVRETKREFAKLFQREISSLKEAEAGGVVYVHCWGGRGRTATVIGCYLIQRNLETKATILDRLKALTAHASKSFWPTPQTAEQGEFITNWNSANSR